MEKKFITKSAGDTRKLASKLLKKYKNHNIFLLDGELGSGKTTFVQGIAKELGIKEKIQSPTFTLERSYNIIKPCLNFKNIKTLVHIDLYRLKKDDLVIRDLSENFDSKNQLTFIEWPDRLGKFLPNRFIQIKFSHIKENQRKILVKVVKFGII